MNNSDGKIWYGIGLDNTGLQRDADKSVSIFKGIGVKAKSECKGLANEIRGLGVAVGIGFGVQQITSFGRTLIEVAGQFQTFRSVLENTLGSPLKADKAMTMIQDFAATTPFQVDALTGAFVKLANQGFVPTVEQLTLLGDLASSTGKGFDQLTEAIIDAQVGEFERLKEFGIRASKQGDKVTFTFKEQATQVDFTASSIRDYILSLGELNGVQGANAKIASTLAGQYSNLQDTITQALNEMGQASSGFLSGAMSSVTYLVQHYEEIGIVLGSLIATYGTYKAALIAVSAYQKAMALVETIKGFNQMTIALRRTTQAQILLNQAAGANPYIKLAAVLLTVVGALVMFSDSSGDSAKAVEEMQASVDSAAESFKKLEKKEQGVKKLTDRIEELKSKTNLTKEETAELKENIKLLADAFPDAVTQVDKYGNAIDIVTGKINQQIEAKRELLRLETQDLREEVADIGGNALEDYRSAQNELNQALEAKKNLKKLYARPEGSFLTMEETNDFAVASKKVNDRIIQANAELEISYGALSQSILQLESLGDNPKQIAKSLTSESWDTLKGTNITSEEVVSISTEAKDEAKKQAELDAKLAEEEKKRKDAEAKKKEDAKKYAREYQQQQKQLATETAKANADAVKAETELERSKITDKSKLLEFDLNQKLSAIEDEREAYIKLYQEVNKTTAEPDTSSFDRRKNAAVLAEAMAQRELAKAKKEQLEADKVAEKEQLERLLEEFATYEQKRINIAKEFSEKRKALYEDDGSLKEGVTQGNVDNIDEAEGDAYEELDKDIASRSESFQSWVDATLDLGLNKLKDSLTTAEAMLANANPDSEETAILKEKIRALETEIKARKKAEQSGDKSNKTWKNSLKVIGSVNDSVKDIIESFDGLDDETKSVLTAAVNVSGGCIAMIKGIQALAVTGAEAIKGVEKASVILAIIGAAVQVLTVIINLLDRAAQKRREELQNEIETCDRLVEAYDEIIDKQRELLEESYGGSAALEAYEKGLDSIGKKTDAAKKSLESWFAYRERYHHSNGYEFDKDFGNSLSQEKLFAMDGEQWETWKNNNLELWAKLPDEVKAYAEALMDGAEQAEELRKALKEANVGLSYEDTVSAAMEQLLDGTITAGEAFDKIMQGAAKNMLANLMNKDIQEWYEGFAAAGEDGYTDEERRYWKEKWENIQAEGEKRKEDIEKTTGVSFDDKESSTNNQSNVGKITGAGLTEESAGEFIGIQRGSYDKLTSIDNTIGSFVPYLTSMAGATLQIERNTAISAQRATEIAVRATEMNGRLESGFSSLKKELTQIRSNTSKDNGVY